MRTAAHLLVGVLCSLVNVEVQACTDCTNASPEPIELAPAPWALKGTVYSITLLPLLAGITGELPVKAYGPLERQFPESIEGRYQGILGMIQIIRYTESPVGPYDELLIIPGYFSYDRKNADGTTFQEQHVRVSRIYVSQKYTAWNGRTNWNIPKHLADFDWTENEDGSSSLKVYPYDTTGDPSESYPASKPWFQMSFTPQIPIELPFNTDLYGFVGINASLAQPPLPKGNDSFGALAGTTTWKTTVPGQRSESSALGTFNLDQGEGDVGTNGTNAVGDEYYPNFWPGLSRYMSGYKLENANISFSAPEVWE